MPQRPERVDVSRDGLGSAGTPGPAKCLIEGCTRLAGPSYARGLCIQCYNKAKKTVESGAHTWATLAAMGLCAAESDADPFSKALKKATGDVEDKDVGTATG